MPFQFVTRSFTGKDSFPMAKEENRGKKESTQYIKRIPESIKSCQITLEESKR